MNRRSFLTALCALPLAGRIAPRLKVTPKSGPDPWVPMTVCPEEGGGQIFITAGKNGYVFDNTATFQRLMEYSDRVALEQYKSVLTLPKDLTP